MRRILTATLASGGLLLFGAVSAQADEHEVWGDWVALDTDDGSGDPYPGTWTPTVPQVASENSTILSPTEAELVWPEDGPNLGTSIEVADLGLDVEAGTAEVTYALEDGAAVAPGAPRLFVLVDGVQYNTFRDGTTTDTGASMDIPAGTVSHVGVAYDNGVPGTVRVTGVSLSGMNVLFAEPEPEPAVCEWDADLLADDEKCVDPDTGDDTDTDTDGDESDDDKTPAAVPTAIPAGSELANTGANAALLGLGGLILLGAGGVLVTLRRRYNQ